MSNEKQFIRAWSLFVGDNAGNGIDISPLRCTFQISKKDTQAPNQGIFTVYNVSKDTANKLKKDFAKIVCNAGYKDNLGLIFTGNITSISEGRQGVDSYIKIYAGDGDKQYNYTVINKSVSAGLTAKEQNALLSESMGLSIDYQSELSSSKLARGKVFYGRPRDYLRQNAKTNNATWSIQDGKILVLKRTELRPDKAIKLSPNTGLIGTPLRDENGINAVCLLNPKLKIGAAVQIDLSYIQDSDTDLNSDNSKKKVDTDKNGEYRLISIEHAGDTHANDWYTSFKCLSISQSANNQKKVKAL